LADEVRHLTRETALAFFDAIAPIVHRDVHRHVVACFQSRYDKAAPAARAPTTSIGPMTREHTKPSSRRCSPAQTTFHSGKPRRPISTAACRRVIADAPRSAVAHGPMKPSGLTNPRDPQ